MLVSVYGLLNIYIVYQVLLPHIVFYLCLTMSAKLIP